MENIVGNRIRTLRKQKGWTQEELGRRLGVQKSVVAKYENGKVMNMKQSTIATLSELFNVKPSYICGFTDESENNYSELISLLDGLNAEGVEEVYKHAKYISSQAIYKKCNLAAMGE